MRQQHVNQRVASSRGQEGLLLEDALEAQERDDRLGVRREALPLRRAQEVGVEVESVAAGEALDGRERQHAVGEEAAEERAVERAHVRPAGVRVVEDGDVERRGVLLVEVTGHEADRQIARAPEVAEDARLADERLADPLVLSEPAEVPSREQGGQDLRGGPSGGGRVEAHEAVEGGVATPGP